MRGSNPKPTPIREQSPGPAPSLATPMTLGAHLGGGLPCIQELQQHLCPEQGMG